MSVPTSDTQEKMFNVPVIVVVLVAAISALRALMNFLPPEFSKWIVLYFAFSPARFWAPDLVFGLPQGMAKVSGVWTLFTHFFVHANWSHVLFNSLWMLAMGSVIARRVAALRFVAFTFFCAAGGALFQFALHPDSYALLVGASGAVSGHMAGVLRLVYSTNGGFSQAMSMDFSRIAVVPLKRLLMQKRALIFIALWIAFNFLSAFVFEEMLDVGGRISWEAHIGGFLAGLLAYSLFDRKQPGPPENDDTYFS